MRQASLKLKMYVGQVGIVDNNNLDKSLFQIMFMSFSVLVLCYFFILGNMVFDIIARKSLEKEAVLLSNEVGGLELSYLTLSNKVDLNLSYSLGFKETKPTYAVRKSFGFLPQNLNNTLSNEIE